MNVMNALGPLLNTGTSHLLSSTVAGEVECYLASFATPAVDWWREKMNSADSERHMCRRHRDVLGLKWHGVCAF